MSTYATAIPNSPEYLQAQAMANQAYQMALANIMHARSQTLQGAGYLDNGGKGNLTIDPNNFYGGIQTLFRNHAQEMAAQNLNYAGRGIQGGVRAGAQYETQQSNAGETSKFGTALDNQLADYANQQQMARQTYDSALWQAQQQALQQALMQQLFNQAAAPAPVAAPVDTAPAPAPTYDPGPYNTAIPGDLSWLNPSMA